MSRQRIHAKIRQKISGTAKKPRLAVYRSLTNLYAQLIDDENSKTLIGVSSIKDTGPLMKKAAVIGKTIAQLAKEKKITEAVFDRGGFRYHGAVKAVCEAAREAGLKI